MIKDIFFLGLMLFVLYGYFSYIHIRFQIYEELLPVIVFSGIGSVIFIAGILNIMDFTWWLIVITGGILAFHSFKNKDCCRITAGLVCFFILTVYLLFFLREQKLFHYDNFSHWGMIVKSLCLESRFPNFESTTISFQAYPVGSACFIWFVCKFLGYTEGHALFAQAMLMLSCIGPLFAFAHGGKKIQKILITVITLCSGVFLLSYSVKVSIGIHNLLVDGLLADIAIAAFAIIFLYREKIQLAIWCVLPLLVFEVCVKNSGIMWVVAILIEAVYFSWKQLDKKELIKYIALILSATEGIVFLWKQHISLVFANASNSSHSMSVSNYKRILEGKTAEDIENIRRIFLQRCFSIDSALLHILIILLVTAVVLRIFYKQIYKLCSMTFCFIYCLIICTIYQIGNFAMYIFSMPLEEANRLAGYERYVMTLEMFIMGVILTVLLQFVIKTAWNQKWYYEWKKLLVIVLLFVSIVWDKNVSAKEWVVHKVYTSGREADRPRMDEIIANNNLEDGKSAIVYISGPNDRDVGYRYHMSRYLLWSGNIKTVNTKQINQLNDFGQYDYLIILDRDPEVIEWLVSSGFTEDTECIKTADIEYVKAATVIENLKSENYLSIISVKDDASTSFTEEMVASMHKIGLQNDLLNCYRKSYIAVIDKGNVIYEALGDERLKYTADLDGVHCEVVSAGFNEGNESQISLNGIDYSNNTRGMNIVVYDKVQKQLISSITFDTWMRDGYYVNKRELSILEKE